ncbi:hypothetical protein SE17_34755 [Kouleothrix aurantiaca]|uniref:Uncharacterized protein n=1 Tax=Kouleothrix aurantiaca TaxID=186479 RepID=A0A0P9D973_9CHLR|nr:hypothetical protein SE17_34755 [Kouleothrix aurantiaca]
MHPDPLFSALVATAFAGSMSARITVQIGGVFIHGALISEKTYFTGIRDQLAYEGTHGATLVANLFQNSLEAGAFDQTTEEQQMNAPMFFLQDAITYAADQPALWLGWWRGRVDAVTGWSWEKPQKLVVEDADATSNE